MTSKKIISILLFLIIQSHEILSSDIANFDFNLPINKFIAKYKKIKNTEEIRNILNYIDNSDNYTQNHWKILFILSDESLEKNNELLEKFQSFLMFELNDEENIIKEYSLAILISEETKIFSQSISNIIIDYVLQTDCSKSDKHSRLLLLLKCDERTLTNNFLKNKNKQKLIIRYMQLIMQAIYKEILENRIKYTPLNQPLSHILCNNIMSNDNSKVHLLFCHDNIIKLLLQNQDTQNIKNLLKEFMDELQKLSHDILLKLRAVINKKPLLNNFIIDYLDNKFLENNNSLNNDYIYLLFLCSTINKNDPNQIPINNKYKNMIEKHRNALRTFCCSLSLAEIIQIDTVEDILNELLEDMKSEGKFHDKVDFLIRNTNNLYEQEKYKKLLFFAIIDTNNENDLQRIDEYLLFYLKIFYNSDKLINFDNELKENFYSNKDKLKETRIINYDNIFNIINYCIEEWNAKDITFKKKYLKSIEDPNNTTEILLNKKDLKHILKDELETIRMHKFCFKSILAVSGPLLLCKLLSANEHFNFFNKIPLINKKYTLTTLLTLATISTIALPCFGHQSKDIKKQIEQLNK